MRFSIFGFSFDLSIFARSEFALSKLGRSKLGRSKLGRSKLGRSKLGRLVCDLSRVDLSVDLSMIGLPRGWNPYFQPRAVPRSRFYRELARQQSYSFPDHRRALAAGFQFRARERAGKRKPFAIIFHRQLQVARALRQAHQHMMRSAMLADVHQAFLHDTGQLAASFLRQIHTLHFADDLRGDSRLPPEALDGVGNETEKPVGIHL